SPRTDLEVDVMGQREREQAQRLAYVQSVPAALSIQGGEVLVSEKAEQLLDYSAGIPGMTVVPTGAPGQSEVIIRGIFPVLQHGYAGVNGGGGELGAPVAFYLDDVPIGGSLHAYADTLSLDLVPYDLERFEVWRGPQGTVSGADSEIGLVRYVLVQPNVQDFSANVAADV